MTLRTTVWMLGALALVGCGSSGQSTNGNQPATDLSVVISATTADYAHTDGLPGQTATSVSAGVRSLTLIDESAGTSWLLFDYGSGGHAVTYDDGAHTTIAVLAPGDVKAGHYTRARMVQDWSRFSINATLHDATTKAEGKLDVLQVTSEGAVVDGNARPQGYYEQTFSAVGVQKSYSGDDAPLPSESKTDGAEAIVESGDWAVYFPVDVTVVDAATGTLEVRVNMHEAFRWKDLPSPDWTDGAYDMAPPLYEPVAQFGGNRFDVSLTP